MSSYWHVGARAPMPVNQIGTQLRKIRVKLAPVVLLAPARRVRVKSRLQPPAV